MKPTKNANASVPATVRASHATGIAHGSKPEKKSFHGFTLVELVVVITILAILGTIGFLSIGGYSSKARDSARVGDVAQISKSLDLSVVTAGTYPVPDNSFAVTYSGGTVWNQGTVGSLVMQYFKGTVNGGGINDKPTDPLKNSEYAYSSLAFGTAYQIKADYENDVPNPTAYRDGGQAGNPLVPTASDQAGNPLLPTASAEAGNPTIAYVRGNYGWLTAKTVTGSFTYVLAIPSIITNSGTGAWNLLRIEQNALSGTLLFNGKPLQNASSYNPNARANSGVVFSGTGGLPASDADGRITAMVTALKSAYSGSDVISNTNVASLLSATGTGAVQSFGTAIVSNQLGGKATTSGGSGTPTPMAPAYASATTYAPSQQFSYGGTNVTVTAAGIGTSGTKSDPSCDTNDIAVWQQGTDNVQIWAACNVGATTSAGYDAVPAQSPNPTATASALPINRVAAVQGNYYQWGRNDIVTSGTWTASQYGGTLTSPANTTWTPNFYQGEAFYGDWKWAGATNPSGGWNAGNGGDAQWPCPSGYHIPTGGTSDTSTQWGTLYAIVNSNAAFGSCNQANAYDRTRCALKLPLAGYRHWINGYYYNQGSGGYYWSSSPYSPNSYIADFSSGGGNIAYSNTRGNGFSLRCLKN